MNGHLPRAGFLRRMAAFVIDAIVVFVLATMLYMVWALKSLGGLPETPDELAVVMYTGQQLVPDLMISAWLAYVVVSSSPLLGNRSVGMRQVGIRVVRADR